MICVQRLKDDISNATQEDMQNSLALSTHMPNEWDFIEQVACGLEDACGRRAEFDKDVVHAQSVLTEAQLVSEQLIHDLTERQRTEKELIAQGRDQVFILANYPKVEQWHDIEDKVERIQVQCLLEQLSRQRPLITFETVMQLFLSSEATNDLQAINPIHNK